MGLPSLSVGNNWFIPRRTTGVDGQFGTLDDNGSGHTVLKTERLVDCCKRDESAIRKPLEVGHLNRESFRFRMETEMERGK